MSDDDVTLSGAGAVIFVVDDPQRGWLEDVSVAITQVHIDEGVDLILNVIPYQISSAIILGPKLQEWNIDYQGLIEIGQHGYDHSNHMGTLLYADQKIIVEDGLAELNAIGIKPKSFTPPYGSQNTDTLDVLGDMGFHTDFDYYVGLSSTSEILVLKQSEALLCDRANVSGPDCNFKSTSALIGDIDNAIYNYGYAVVSFHVQDFSTRSGGLNNIKLNQYRQMLTVLKNSGRYQFMTAEEFPNGREGKY
jgi:peptidoglycan/xylan/chitin deacetylase (PgdA/CDA1 family)